MDNKKSYLLNTTKYCGVQGFFWMLYDAVMAYISVYLLANNFTNSEIGVLTSISCIIAVFIQPIVGGILDKSKKLTLHMAMVFYSLAIIIGAVVLVIGTDSKALNLIIYGVFITFIQSMLAIVNSLGIHYINRGVKMNFGIARGMGSIFYAIASVTLGSLIDMWGIVVIPGSMIIITTLLIVCTFIFRYPKIDKEYMESKTVTETKEKSKGNFIKKYPKFTILTVGLAIVALSHNITCNFAFQIFQNILGEGKGSSEMGIFLGIAAIVEIPTLFAFDFIMKKVKVGTLFRISATMFVLKALFTWLSSSVIALYLCQVLQMVAYAIYAAASVYYADDIMEEQDRVKGQSFMTLSFTAGTVVGSAVGGFVIDQFG
ncbi:MAG: MFS transporter, partial [Clostridia bacterium]|nr:MFS transporter [Clostridia bacterium]